MAQAGYESMRDEILDQLKAAMPVDGVLLGLHGAMVAFGYDDCEGDLIERVREIVGPKAVIGVEQDPHCHLTEKRVRGADVMILFKEYPHIDFAERADELVTLVVKAIRGDIRPKMSLYDCGMIDLFPTTREPGRSFVDKMKSLEGRDGVLSVSLGHGFPQGDVPEHGTRVLVVTDNAKPKGDALARELGEEVRAKRGTWRPPALEHRRGDRRRLCGAEGSGGGRGRVRQCGRRGGLRQHQHHPPAARARRERRGGRPGVGSGRGRAVSRGRRRRDAHAALRRQDRGHIRRADRRRGDRARPRARTAGRPSARRWCQFGDGAGIRIGGVDVALIAHRTQALGTEIFTASGIDLASKRYIGVKSTNHFHAAYAPIAAKVLYCDGEGPSPIDTRKYPFKKARRTIWPHVELPEGRLIV